MTQQEAMKIIEIALAVNGMNKREKEHTGGLPTVFIDFFGHIAEIRIRVHEDGWISRADDDRNFEFKIDKPLDNNGFADYESYMSALLEGTHKNSPAAGQAMRDDK